MWINLLRKLLLVKRFLMRMAAGAALLKKSALKKICPFPEK
jgi:hypothetical protein